MKSTLLKTVNKLLEHSLHPSPLSAGVDRWGSTSNQMFKMGGLDRNSAFRGGDFFQGGGLQFSSKK